MPSPNVQPLVLVAEDEPAILQPLEEFLGSLGYRVRAVSDGSAALEAVRETPPDLMILDVSMPHLSGLDVAVNVRFVHGMWTIPILIITGRSDLATRRRALHAGANSVIVKPFDLGTLAREIERLFEQPADAWLNAEDRYRPVGEPNLPTVPDNAERVVARLSSVHRATLGELARAADARGQHGPHHSVRVARLASMIAVAMKLDEPARQQVGSAGILHDIGLALLPDSILAKGEPLTEDERRQLNGHSGAAATMIDVPPFDAGAVFIVRHHHERWDGSGYPDGLQGDEIPMGARVMAVADAFAAMTSPRDYAARLSPAAAMEELERCAGSQFDPAVVAAFREAAHL